MHSSLYMLEKELIEHKSVTRLPLFLTLCTLVLLISFISKGLADNVTYQLNYQGDVSLLPIDLTRGINVVITFIVGIMSLLLTTMYIPKTFRKERKEGSAMFWRSMPISPLTMHVIKLVFGLVVIPLICSVALLCINLMIWIGDTSLPALSESTMHLPSFGGAVLNWLLFVGRMLLAGLALLPLACFTLALSQVNSSPVLIMTVGGYAASWLGIVLLGSYTISDFFGTVIGLPYQILVSSNPFSPIVSASFTALLIYSVIGLIGFLASMQLYKTNEISWRNLLSF